MGIYWLFGELSNVISGYKNDLYRLMDSKINSVYERGSHFMKSMLTNLFLVILSLFFIFVGFAFLPIAIIVYSPWDDQVKMTVAIIVSVVYILLGALIVYFAFKQKRWKRAA
jgi:pilus assembly protein TadC